MRRLAFALLTASLAGGCINSSPRSDHDGYVSSWDRRNVRHVPGVIGPHGERVPMSAAAMYGPQSGPPVPMSMVGGGAPMLPGQMMPPGGMPMMPPGMPPGMMPPPHPGMLQQIAAFGPGGPVIPANHPMGPQMGPQMAGASPAAMSAMAMSAHPRFPAQRTQVRFVKPSGMKVSWYTQGPDGKPAYSSTPIDAPGRYNFPQAAIYRLKLGNIEGRPGLEIYPTMEVVPTNPKTESFLAHSSVPVEFTPDDFKRIADGSYVVKVIYLPDPQFQDAASTGTEELLSTTIEPGLDPIQEALRRGSILLIIRMGNVDQEAPNTPPLNATAPLGAAPNPMMNFGPIGSGPPGTMVPFGPMGGGISSGAPGPQSLMNAPGGLPPAISSMPLPANGTNPTNGVPVSRSGRASVSSPAGPALPMTPFDASPVPSPVPSPLPNAPMTPPALQ
jgi:hypothetical protein